MTVKAFKFKALSVAISAAFILSSAEAAAPASLYNYATSIKNSSIQMTFVKSMEANYTRTIKLFSSLVTDTNTARWGNQAWYQNIVNQFNWYNSELAKYQALEAELTAPPAPAPAPVVIEPAPAPIVAEPTPSKFNIDQTPADNAQWYKTGGRTITVEQLQMETVLKQGGVLAAWDRGLTGKGVKVAVLDQGFDVNHADLKGQVAEYKNFYPGAIKSTNEGWGVHGTAMASIVAGKLNNGVGTVGVAPEAQLLLAQIGQGGTMSNINGEATVAALKWADAQGAAIVSMSFASTYDTTFRNEIVNVSKGVWQAPERYGSLYGQAKSLAGYTGANNSSVLVSAAGNQGLPYAAFPGAFATQVGTDGNLIFGGRWLIVGSVDANNNISSFSNRAGHICTDLVGTTCNDTYQVKDFYVVAPGERIVVSRDTASSTDTVATVSSGTSGATAYVSGGLALMKQAWPHLSSAQLVALVKETATDLGEAGVDEVYGYGLVNFDKATQPKGDLKVANVSFKTSVVGSGASVSNTGASVNGTMSLATSSVLKNTMTVDGIGRQYSVDFTRAMSNNNITSYQYSSPWLALAASGYKEVASPLTKTTSMKMMKANGGIASQVNVVNGNTGYSLQFGNMSESDGFLGNKGAGALALGNSNTTFAQAGVEKAYGNTQVFANYGVGFTKAGSVQDSMIKLDSTIVSQSWKLGVAQSNVFFDSNTTDQLSFSIGAPVTVARGKATITGVTGYNFNENADGSVGVNAVVASEQVSLRPSVQPLDLVIGYSVMTKKSSKLDMNLAYQINAGGVAGNTASGMRVTYNMQF